MLKCPKCGFVEIDGMNFCSQCGSRLSGSDTLPVQRSEPVRVVRDDPEVRIRRAKEIEEARLARKQKTTNALQWLAFGLIAFFIVISFSVFWFQWFDLSASRLEYLEPIYVPTNYSVTIFQLFAPFGTLTNSTIINEAQIGVAFVTTALTAFAAIAVVIATILLAVFFIRCIVKRDFTLPKFKSMFVKYTIFLVAIAALVPFNGYSFLVPLVLSIIFSGILIIASYVVERVPQNRSKSIINAFVFALTLVVVIPTMTSYMTIGAYPAPTAISSVSGQYKGISIMNFIVNFHTADSLFSSSDPAAINQIVALVAVSYFFILASTIVYALFFSEFFKNPRVMTKKIAVYMCLLIGLTFISFAMLQSTNLVIKELKEVGAIRMALNFTNFDVGWIAYSPFLISGIGILSLVSYIKDRNVKNA